MQLQIVNHGVVKTSILLSINPWCQNFKFPNFQNRVKNPEVQKMTFGLQIIPESRFGLKTTPGPRFGLQTTLEYRLDFKQPPKPDLGIQSLETRFGTPNHPNSLQNVPLVAQPFDERFVHWHWTPSGSSHLRNFYTLGGGNTGSWLRLELDASLLTARANFMHTSLLK